MITIPSFKDIAKKANVSYGTVSNVINKRANVSLEKIIKVEKAAEELGYYINKNASSLRSGKTNNIAFIIPTLEDFTLRKIHHILIEKAASENLNINLFVTNSNPLLEKEMVKSTIATSEFLIVSSCIELASDFYNELNNKSKIILLNNWEQLYNKNIYQINYNWKEFFSNIGDYLDDKHKNILFFSDYYFNDQDFPLLNDIKTVTCGSSYNLVEAIHLLSEKTYDLIIATSYEKKKAIKSSAYILNLDKIPDIIYISTQDEDYSTKDIQYYPNLNLFIDEIWKIILKNKYLEQIVSVPFLGFNQIYKNKATDSFIKILMIESPSTEALVKLIPYIENKLGFGIIIDTIRYDEYDLLYNPSFVSKYDLIRMDMANLSEAANTFLKPLDKRFENLYKRFINNIDSYSYYNNKMYALPFDVAAMILLYRDDIFNNQVIKRHFFEKTKKHTMLPKTFYEYNQVEKFFNENYYDVFNASTVCYKSSITAGNEFIIRVGHDNIVNSSGELNLEDESLRIALNYYKESIKFAKNKDNIFWDDVIKEYSKGSTIMAITYSNYIHTLRNFNEDLVYKTNYSPVPSNKTLIGGGVIGVSKYSNKDDLSYLFLETLYSDNISKLLIQLGATIPIKSIFNDKDLIYRYPWLALIPNIIKKNIRGNYLVNGNKVDTITYEKTVGRLVKKNLSES